MVLEEAFIQKCQEAFNTFDADGSGTIDTQGLTYCVTYSYYITPSNSSCIIVIPNPRNYTTEMKLLLESIGESLTEEELFRFMADVDEDGTGEIGLYNYNNSSIFKPSP